MKVDLFDFDLPDHLIAQHPANPRESARLLGVPATGPFRDHRVAELPDLLTERDILVVNDTKVIPTRLFGVRGTVAIEVTLIEEVSSDSWFAFAKPGKRLKVGDTVRFTEDVDATVRDKLDDGRVGLTFGISGARLRETLWRIGSMPLPPYIKRGRDADTEADRRDYQTVFAEKEGAVAAPTASLHFTEALLERIAARGIRIERLTLHVGAGTFLPVKADDTRNHVMHSEHAHLPPDVAERLVAHRATGGRIVAVGTTAMRTLESAARADGTLKGFEGETDLFITPGFRFNAVDRLMTNFHLPKSTLFMLVSAFSGLDRMKAAYAHAVDKGYRFFSYGDSSLLDRAEPET
jgi:S-adenosylmethionine:tRNA ribosyltransferase-isomerase